MAILSTNYLKIVKKICIFKDAYYPKIYPTDRAFFKLAGQLNQKYPLFIVAVMINWQFFEDNFKVQYSAKMDAQSKPIRLMVAIF